MKGTEGQRERRGGEQSFDSKGVDIISIGEKKTEIKKDTKCC